jgi:hypothetical protein
MIVVDDCKRPHRISIVSSLYCALGNLWPNEYHVVTIYAISMPLTLPFAATSEDKGAHTIFR